eukprot:970986-Rhodomonas_salina.2
MSTSNTEAAVGVDERHAPDKGHSKNLQSGIIATDTASVLGIGGTVCRHSSDRCKRLGQPSSLQVPHPKSAHADPSHALATEGSRADHRRIRRPSRAHRCRATRSAPACGVSTQQRKTEDRTDRARSSPRCG